MERGGEWLDGNFESNWKKHLIDYPPLQGGPVTDWRE